jgi:hypothetical protein
MDGKRTVLIVQVLPKNEEEYGKFHNPKYVHKKDFHVISLKKEVSLEFVSGCRSGSAAYSQLEDELRESGYKGTFSIKEALGGLGRRGKYESVRHWRAKRKSGMPEICRITVD